MTHQRPNNRYRSSIHRKEIAFAAAVLNTLVFQGCAATADNDPGTNNFRGDSETVDTSSKSPLEAALIPGCEANPPYHADAYSFAAAEGDVIQVRVDTVAPETTSNLYAIVSKGLVNPWYDDLLQGGDDDFDCSFPPSAGRCPEYSWVVTSDTAGVHFVVVGVFVPCADPARAEYVLSVLINDVHSDLAIERDDWDIPNYP